MKTKIFIDFDGTVFDTAAYGRLLWEVFIKAGFDLDEIEATYKASYLDYRYSPERHIEKLARVHDFDQELAQKRVNKLFDEIPRLIFSDVVPFLEEIDREKYQVDLLSLGDISFQERKINASKLEKYFDRVYTVDKQKWLILPELVGNKEYFVIIDNRGDAMEEIGKKFKKSLPIEIIRSKDQHDSMEAKNHFSGVKVKSLTQILKYL